MNQDSLSGPSCVLCQLVQGSLPSRKVLETDEFLVIYDKYPRAKVHLLVIDKKHRVKKDTVFGKYQSQGYWDKVFEVISQTIKKLDLDKTGYRVEVLGAGLNHFEHEHVHIMSGN